MKQRLHQWQTELLMNERVERQRSGYVSDPDRVNQWYEVQVPLLPEVENFKVSRHINDNCEPGACLHGFFKNWSVEIGIEDARSAEDVTYYVVQVLYLATGDEMMTISGVILMDDAELLHTELLEICQANDYERLVRLVKAKTYDRIAQRWVPASEAKIQEAIDWVNSTLE